MNVVAKVLSTVPNGMSAADAERARSLIALGDIESAIRTLEAMRPANEAAGFEFLTREQMDEPQGEPDWVVRGLGICPGRPAATIGKGSSGKTTLASLLALCVTNGARLLGEFHCPQADVAWLDFEMGRRASLRKFRRLCRGHGLDWPTVLEHLSISVYPRTFLNSPGAEVELTRAVAGKRLCVVDSLRRSLPGIDENDSRIADYLQMMSRVSEATGCAFLVVHHDTTKTADNGKKRDLRSAGRGSSAIFDGSGSYIVIDGPEGEPPKVTHVREPQEGRHFAPFHIRIEDVREGDDEKAGLRIAYLTPEQVSAPSSPVSLFNQRKRQVLDCIRQNPGARGQEAVARLLGFKDGKSVAPHIEDLMADGVVEDRGQKGRRGRAVELWAVQVPE